MDPIIPQPQSIDSTSSPQLPEPKHFLNKKFAITLVILLLLGGGAYAGIWYWQNQQVAQEAVPTFTPRASALVTPDPVTANWPIFNSKLLNFSFKYPSVASYQEKDVFEGNAIAHTGKDVYFTDKNSQSSAFSVITNDFSVNDSIPHDLMQGTLSTGNFTLNIFDEKYQKKREVAPGMYEVVGYGNMECSPFMGAFLIVSPPKGSNFKYESFNLYSTPSVSGFIPSDMDSSSSDAQCTPKESVINSKVDYLFSQKDPVLERSLATAIEIASTFQTASQTVDTSTWKLFNSKYFSLSFKVPTGLVVTDAQNSIGISEGPLKYSDIGGSNIFFGLSRYSGTDTKSSVMALTRRTLKNIKESQLIVDGTPFLMIRGDDYGRYEGDSAGKVTVVFFDASWVQVVEKPGVDTNISHQDFISIGDQILSTFKFTK